MNKNDLIDELDERLPENHELTAETVEAVLQTYADLRLPELRERLKKYEGSQYKTFGKINELEDMKDL